jgi:hypothetical protein
VYEQFGSVIKESKEEITRLSKLGSEYITYERILEIYNELSDVFVHDAMIRLRHVAINELGRFIIVI